MKETVAILTLIAIVGYLGYKIYVARKWSKASSKYVENDMKVGDDVHVSTSENGVVGKVVKIEEETVDVIVTVPKFRIYLTRPQ
jgi:preprotein translocase subunit YajC